ncbi:hypothetical protein KM043_016589 [Ampulex compressa]|nr:hypothetical protein KM043_016589 [Ampulex compressa]
MSEESYRRIKLFVPSSRLVVTDKRRKFQQVAVSKQSGESEASLTRPQVLMPLLYFTLLLHPMRQKGGHVFVRVLLRRKFILSFDVYARMYTCTLRAEDSNCEQKRPVHSYESLTFSLQQCLVTVSFLRKFVAEDCFDLG